MRSIVLSPSLICADMCNLERDVRRLEALGLEALHVDILDGHFSPSMPLGLDTVRQLRKKTSLDFDAHVMTTDNGFFVEQLLDIGVRQLCFHVETERHPDRLLSVIQSAGVRAGLALGPGTPLTVLEYLIERVDYVLLMLINPGYAGHGGETMVPYALRKVEECRALIQRRKPKVLLEVDGRVSFASIPGLVAAGADWLVAGTSCLFGGQDSWENNLGKTREAIASGLSNK